MKNMHTLCLLFVLVGCSHAQQVGTKIAGPVRVLPAPPSYGSGNRAEVVVPDAANTNPLYILNSASSGGVIDGSFLANTLNIQGSSSVDGRILLRPGSVNGSANVTIQGRITATHAPSLIVDDPYNDKGVDLQVSSVSYLKINNDDGGLGGPTFTTTGTQYRFNGAPIETRDPRHQYQFDSWVYGWRRRALPKHVQYWGDNGCYMPCGNGDSNQRRLHGRVDLSCYAYYHPSLYGRRDLGRYPIFQQQQHLGIVCGVDGAWGGDRWRRRNRTHQYGGGD